MRARVRHLHRLFACPHQGAHFFRRQRFRQDRVHPVGRIQQAGALGELRLELGDDLFQIGLVDGAQKPRTLDERLQFFLLEEA